MAAYDYIGIPGEDGMVLGQDADHKVGFWGVTPCDQAAAMTTAVTALTYVTSTVSAYVVTATLTGFYFAATINAQGFAQIVQNIAARIGQLEDALSECGLIA